MYSRRQLLHYSALFAALAAMAPLSSISLLAAEPLLARRIPSSGEELPAVGLGTSRTHDVSLDDEALTPLLEVLRTLVEGGGSLVDTAPSYGRAERVVGELARRLGARERLFLASKVSASGQKAGRRQIEASFKALQTDRIDLLQVHNLQDTATQLALLRELKGQGRLRYIGVTHYLESAHDDLLAVLRKEKVDFVQFNYSVGERNAEKRLLPFCADHGIATLINRPFMRGALFARVKGQSLPPLAQELGATSWAQLLLKYILAEPAVTAVIPATDKPRYMADNLLAAQGRLPDAGQRARIVELFA
ncbi:Aldo/keto reductase [Azotobacter vinelandii CA]|uniref:Aldo/keto reductase n=2 Tax=Azotobacter vinelandii TaxID=354 RepID=C1DKA6_AZOVD|nr:aldo/keto reductase [Azotobacter vinelandii]ACO81011.1 Aldo/keto reductase [Azotobacter vinelandii DJ]AGK15825.1 Aldo/keto reductase [Azotobacter vinelandii CA]AGK22291.1 Aldo/keto reductase [Azotobacter vinelandii CA6]SFW98433.1 Aldo/keto reductase [Azotobacter vinelandii]GLK60513.1 aldo/keto reductase [Azotobacter vinelandii]